MRNLLPFILTAALALYALLSWAHDGQLDELGCHIEDVTGAYQCHEGVLRGREFVSKEEALGKLDAQHAVKEADQAEEKSLGANAPLKILAWNMSQVGTKKFEYDRIAAVMGESDIVILQEVEFSKTGETSLIVIADLLSRRLNARVCKGWFKSSGGERARHAFIWKDASIAYVDRSGGMIERCPDAPQVMTIEDKKIDPEQPFHASFFLRSRKQMFTLSSVLLAKKPKRAVKHITAAFKKLSAQAWPAIVVGDFKVSAKDKAFGEVSKMGFKSALAPAKKKGAENLWTKGVSVVQAERMDLYDRFSDLSRQDVDSTISTRAPLLLNVSFSQEEADALKTQLIKKPKAQRNEKVEAKIQPQLQPYDVHDDLESEARESETPR